MLTTAERAELAMLRARAFGAGGVGLDAVESGRLELLEALRVGEPQTAPVEVEGQGEPGGAVGAGGASGAEDVTHSVADDSGSGGATSDGDAIVRDGTEPVTEMRHPDFDADPDASPVDRLRRLAPIVGIAIGALVLGAALGVWLAPILPPLSVGAVDADRYPEFSYPATDEDVLPGEGGFTDVIDPDTSRFIAFIDDTVVWLAIAEDRGGICLIALTSPDFWSAECGASDVTIEVDGRTFRAHPASSASESGVDLSPSVTMTEPGE